MKEGAFAKLCVTVGELSSDQRNALLDRLTLLGASSTANMPTDTDDWLLPGILQALKEKGLLSTSAVAAMRRSAAFKAYRRNSKDIMKELVKLIRIPLNSALKASLAYNVGIALIVWCEKRKISGNISVLLNNTIHAAEALEEQFPGYAAGGLLHLIIKD